MLAAKTVFEEILDNDEASRLFCSEVGGERGVLAWHGPTTRRTTSSSTPDRLRPLTHKELLIQGCVLASPVFERIARPTADAEGRRATAMRFGDPRVQALA